MKKSHRPTFMEFFRLHHPTYKAIARGLRIRNTGKRLAAVRKANRLTQSELASWAGIPRSSLGRIERGEEKLGLHRAELLAKRLKVEPAELLFGLPRSN